MKRCLAFVVGLALANSVVAQQAGIPVQPAPTNDTVEAIHPISSITNRIPAVRYPFAAGRLDKIDLGKRQLTLTDRGGTYHFSYEDRTYIFLDKQKITADALKPGDLLKINFITNAVGEATIRRIKAKREEAADAGPSLLPAQSGAGLRGE